jgi:integrase
MDQELIIVSGNSYSLDTYNEPICQDGTSIESLIASFLLTKTSRTNSQNTLNSYRRILIGFRQFLQSYGLDLIMYTSNESGFEDYRFIRTKIAEHASIYSKLSKNPTKKMVSNASRNQTLACLSSFYEYADKLSKSPFSNPIKAVEYSHVEVFSEVKPLEVEALPEQLAAIDRSTPIGKRDYALLSILLFTGSRVTAILMLDRKDLEVSKRGIVTLTLRHMKGGKKSRKQLSPGISDALLEYLEIVYQKSHEEIHPDHAVFLVLSKAHNNHFQYGDRLGYQAARNVCDKYLGTTRVHRTRHTAGLMAVEAGARMEDVMKLLDHSSPNITQKYMPKIEKPKNLFEEQFGNYLGTEEGEV